MPDSQQKYYDAVAEELAQNVLKPGVWARAMAEVGTDDASARAAYIRLRVAELKEAENEQQPSPVLSPPPSGSLVKSGPMGVGGWLTFFCIGLTILSPLFSLGRMIISYERIAPMFGEFPDLNSAVMVEDFCILGLLIYGFIIGVSIWRGSENGRTFARHYLKDRLWCFLIFEFIVYCMISDLPSRVKNSFIEAIVGACLREVVFFAIWWNYFKKSKRVINTYGAE